MDLPLQLGDLHPISQLESLYKLVAKVSVGRLAGVIDKKSRIINLFDQREAYYG